MDLTNEIAKNLYASFGFVEKPEYYKEGDEMWVKCLGTDNRGKIKLSAKRVNQETGEDLEK